MDETQERSDAGHRGTVGAFDYVGHGEAPGAWVGRSARRLGLTREVAGDDLAALLVHADPATRAPLTRGRSAPKVAGCDLTFCAPKSVSLLWAFGSPDTAAAVVAAHETAVRSALAVMEVEAGRVRRGRGGASVVPAEGLVAAGFRHRTSRAGDPRLHTHVAPPTTTITAPTSTTGTYAVDATHSRIGFVARHAMVTKVRGSFNEFEGSGYFDAENPASSNLQLTIKAASIDTRNADRDGHLKGNDFFDMETYPEITFASTAVEHVDDERYRVTGDLTIKGVTKPVTVDFEYTGTAIDPYGNTRVGFEGKTTVNRKDWGVSWNAAFDAGGVLVSEKVTLEFEVSAIRTSDAA